MTRAGVTCVFDPRYNDERDKSGRNPRVWTIEAETEAVRCLEEIAEGRHPDDFTVQFLYREGDAKPFLWEEDYYRYLKESAESEGTVIPKLHRSDNVVPPAQTHGIEPPAVPLEYIPGMTLAEYKASKRPNIPSAIFRPQFDAISKFGDGGVFHGDISGSNILVSPSEVPVRAVLIDFGRAGLREEGELEEDWTDICRFHRDEMMFVSTLIN
ncbi:hypothetical protein M413DRAFT_30985 [Hebeloma cylindrosporum]|uniref:Protein kinase domain-containing protein n=1 Tax=Hebeloma cylindrosporum TaxID=76867 RepID=A0A0C2Y8C1_HEBCY|nr:hypothetical protein M413DRAFT_30985 [Hebeloma cylindrosporum h7]